MADLLKPLLLLSACWPLAHAVTNLRPPELNLPNYNRLPIGHWGALEGGAYTARGHGSESIWYNPAGIAQDKKNTVSVNALLLEFTNVELRGLGTSSGTNGFQQLPTFFGTTFDLSAVPDKDFAFGFAVISPNQYNQHAKLDQKEFDSSTTLTTESVLDSKVDISVLQPHFAMAWKGDRSFSIGGALWLSWANTVTSESSAIRVREPTNTIRGSQVFFVNGDHESLDLGISFGAQWQPSERWKLGIHMRSPALHLDDNSSFNVELTLDTPNETVEVNFLDTHIDYEVRYPLTLTAGAAYTTGRWEAECNVKYYQSIGHYDVFKSDEQITTLTYDKTTSNTTITEENLGPVPTHLQQVVNVAVGAHYHVNDMLMVHAGAYTDFTPVASRNDEVYSKLDTYGVTLGVSKKGEINTTSFGINYNWGSHDIEVEDPFSATTGTGSIRIENIGLLFATSFRY